MFQKLLDAIPPRYRPYIAALAVLALGGTVTVTVTLVDSDGDGRPDTPRVTVTGPPRAPVAPAPVNLSTPPEGRAIPGKTPAQEQRIDERNDDTVDEQTYDTSGVLGGAAGEGAKHICYTPQNGGPRAISDIGLGVVHVTVSRNVRGPGDGNALCSFFRNVKASPTWTVDNDGDSWENVPLNRVPWTQAYYNRRACSIEFVGSTGRPGEGAAEWTDAQYREGARLMAFCFRTAGIPVRWGAVTAGGVITRTGLITHQELGLLGGGHSDPGPYFNRTLFANYVALYVHGAKPATPHARALCQELNELRRVKNRTSAEAARAQKLKQALAKNYVCKAGPPGSIRRR